jgi:hypothetical protein
VTSTWLDQTRLPISAIVHALGWDGRRSHYPCPAKCEGTDPRPVYSTGNAFSCRRCGAKGDAADFVAYTLHGGRLSALDAEGRAAVREWFGVSRPVPVPVQAPTTPPPPPEDLAAFWDKCRPVTRDRQVAEYLRSRGVSPDAVAHLDLARATPPYADLPDHPWWPRWWGYTWRLVVCGYREGGLANLHARAVVPPPKHRETGEDMPAKRWAKGLRASGCVLWNRVPPDTACLVLVTEGITDWLTAATAAYQSPVTVYGATSGSFDRLRLPAHRTIVVASDPDAAGDEYARALRRSLPSHNTIHRMPLPRGVDLNTYVAQGGSVRRAIASALASPPMDPP